jgi:hypothetical protein
LKTCSAIGGAAGAGPAWPLVMTTAESHATKSAATLAIDRFDLCVIAPPTIPIPIASGNVGFFHVTISLPGFDSACGE